MKKKILFFLLSCFVMQVLQAQKKVIPENIRCWSIYGPVMTYWQNEEIRRNFAGQLNTFLLKYHHLPLADTTQLAIQVLSENSKSDRIPLPVKDNDTSNLHMYLDIFENTPFAFFSHIEKTAKDSLLMNRAKSVFQIQLILAKSDRVVFNNTLDIIISAGSTPGMGIVSNTVALTAKGFAELLKTGMNLLMNPENDLSQIEVTVSPAFVADNFIIAKTSQQPRVYVFTTKDISTYAYKNKSQMIRLGGALYEEIRIKGKNPDKLPDAIMEAIRKTDHFSVSDYVFLRQECRDVLQNKNYLLKLLVQIDPENRPANNSFLFSNFVSGNFHYLFNEKDTVAIFAIEKAVTDPAKKIYINTISNGFDSASFVPIDTHQPVWPLVYDYVVKGKISKSNFSIKCCGYRNTIKEIYLDDKLICIAQGKFTPEKFVFFDASLSPELLNQLFMIGFNRFFE